MHPINVFKMMDLSAIRTYKRGPYHFCMFSRVMLEKGVEDAVRAIRSVNEKIGESVALLDIYELIENKYEKELSIKGNRIQRRLCNEENITI